MTETSLASLHRRLHGGLITRLLSFYETLTTLDLTAARADWAAFERALDAHAGTEEAHIFPACRELVLPAKASLDLLERDHRLVEAGRHRVAELLDQLEADPPEARRARLVRSFDPLVRLHRVLEHHGMREDDIFYPIADAHLPEDQRHQLATLFEETTSRAK